MGPYETEQDALREPMPREVRALHTAGRVRPGDPDRIARGTALRHMTEACRAAGVELGAHDRRTLAWLAEWETDTAQVVIGLVARAHEAGKRAEQPDPITPEVYGEFFPERDEAGVPLLAEQPEAGRHAQDEQAIRADERRDIARQLDMLAGDDKLIADWATTFDPIPLTMHEWLRALAGKIRRP